MQGIYILIIELAQTRNIDIGKRRDYSFKAGYYACCGSALNDL